MRTRLASLAGWVGWSGISTAPPECAVDDRVRLEAARQRTIGWRLSGRRPYRVVLLRKIPEFVVHRGFYLADGFDHLLRLFSGNGVSARRQLNLFNLSFSLFKALTV